MPTKTTVAVRISESQPTSPPSSMPTVAARGTRARSSGSSSSGTAGGAGGGGRIAGCSSSTSRQWAETAWASTSATRVRTAGEMPSPPGGTPGSPAATWSMTPPASRISHRSSAPPTRAAKPSPADTNRRTVSRRSGGEGRDSGTFRAEVAAWRQRSAPPSAGRPHTARSPSPANFTTSPPCRSTSAMSAPNHALSVRVRVSTPSGPRAARRSVNAVKPEMSAKSAATGRRNERRRTRSRVSPRGTKL